MDEWPAPEIPPRTESPAPVRTRGQPAADHGASAFEGPVSGTASLASLVIRIDSDFGAPGWVTIGGIGSDLSVCFAPIRTSHQRSVNATIPTMKAVTLLRRSNRFWTLWLTSALISRALAAQPGAGPVPAPDLFRAIRSGDAAAVRAQLKAGADVRGRDGQGNTPLMQAALGADVSIVDRLLKAGAEVNATNQAGATALMRAATSAETTRRLIAAGADVRARSQLGNTALHMAARHPGNSAAVKLLIDRGADVNATNVFGATALMAAVAAEDMESVRLLVDHGADVNAKPIFAPDGLIWGGGRTPLMWAAFRGHEPLARYLLQRGARVNEPAIGGSALSQAAWHGSVNVARLLLDTGAQVDQRDLFANYTPLHWAASSESTDPALARLLLQRGADANAEGGQPVDGFLGTTRTPLQLALKRGETPIVEALRTAGARTPTPVANKKSASRPARSVPGAIDDSMIADAIRQALPPLAKTAAESPETFLRHRSNQRCISCHQQSLPLSAISVARSRHFPVDEAAARQTADLTEGFAAILQEMDLQTVFHPEPAIGNGYSLLSLHLEGRSASPMTDSMVHQLTAVQRVDGSWAWNLPRPPIQSGDLAATALAVQGLRHFPIPARAREFETRIGNARRWLRQAKPESSEERAYQLLGLAWSGESRTSLKSLATALVATQNADGSWSQLPKLPGDAYGTGLAMYALLAGGELPARHEAIQRAAAYLLRTQLADGTWHVERRAFPFQPPMDSGFPHGADGWISAAASSWAVMGLALTLDPAVSPSVAAISSPTKAESATTPVVAASSGPVDFNRDIRPLLERSCVTCHSGERAKGGFVVTSRASLLQGGARGEPMVRAGQGSKSLLVQLVSDQVEDLEMPPVGRRDQFPALSPDEIARLRSWIDQGAEWPAEVHAAAPR